MGFHPALLAALQHPDNKRRVLNIISKLEPDYWLERNLVRYQDLTPWFDTATLLNWFAHTLKPRNYLEIGVRRGRSMAQVLVESPGTQGVGFDLWIPDYGSLPEQGIHTPNPGPEFVLAELKKLGVSRLPQLVRGDSHTTVPAFWNVPANPQSFDLILVDGDHTADGARADLEIAFAHLAPGGALIFDDICNTAHLDLRDLWDEFARQHPDYLFLNDHSAAGTGVAFRPPFQLLTQAVAGENPISTNAESMILPAVPPQENLPIHFLTIVLNGQPFIRHHFEQMRQLPFRWHWHIVEGVAELSHDTAWSKASGGKIPAELHRDGLSVDGTTEYLDALKEKYPDNITVYRPPIGKFWDGKREMVNAPLANITAECLLWQVDADERGEADPQVLELSPTAREWLRDFSAWLEPRLAETADLGHMTDWAGKLVGAVVRLAGILHMVEHAGGGGPWQIPIGDQSVKQAVRIGGYLIGHARAAFGEMGADQNQSGARHLLNWIRTQELREFTKRDAFEATKGRFRQVATMEPAISLLEDHGCIRQRASAVRNGPGRKPSPSYEVNPYIFTREVQDGRGE